jgi:drug/metabolite transporter (DMT)-like permease
MSDRLIDAAFLRRVTSRWIVAEPSPYQKWALLAGGYALLASSELAFHWLLSRPALSPVASVYLLRTANSGMAIFPDFLVPIVCLAGWHNWVDRFNRGQPPSLSGALASVFLALGVVVLLPYYASYFPQESMWARPAPWLYGLWFFWAFIFLWFFRWGDPFSKSRR